MDFLKTIGGKIATGLVMLAVIAAAISWYQMDPATRHAIYLDTGRIVAWFSLVVILPWATFFVIGAVARAESNLAGALLVLGYTILEAIALAWLFQWSLHGALPVILFGAAALFAAAYNLFSCDWIAEKL